MKKLLRCASIAALATLAAGSLMSASAADLKLTMRGGRVTIVATDVPLRQILQEWARVGQTRIVNGDKLAGPPLTIQLIDVPEPDALDVLLRSASGFMAAPRPAGAEGLSVYDRILIMPTSRPPAITAANTQPLPAFPRPMPAVAYSDESDEPIVPNIVPPPGMSPMSGAPGYPPNYPGAPGAVPPGAPSPVLTSPRPGALPTPPATVGAPNPYQPLRIGPNGQPIIPRPGGGGGE